MTRPDTSAALEADDYDEFQFLPRHAAWAGVPWSGPPVVARDALSTSAGSVSFLRWGSEEPELVLLHGGGQNAHTWDSFVLAVGRPAVALDLPGHGRSQWRSDGNYFPGPLAAAVAEVLDQVAPAARGVVGMSLGGLTVLKLATLRPDLVHAAVIVDVTPNPPDIPGPREGKPMAVHLMSGPRTFGSWDEMLDAVQATMPHRTREDLVPGVRHNARRQEDGSWAWRYDRPFRDVDPRPELRELWTDVEAMRMPTMLVTGGLSPIVDERSEAEFRRRLPGLRVECVSDAGHSVQSDQPVALARLVDEFLGG